jgi:hypothetical protein
MIFPMNIKEKGEYPPLPARTGIDFQCAELNAGGMDE